MTRAPVHEVDDADESAESWRAELQRIVSHIGHLLPAQGPISVFIHHNPLHAFEDMPFEEAAERAAELFGCEPYLPEEDYRKELQRGRLHESDIDAVLAETDTNAEAIVLAGLSLHETRMRILVHGLPEFNGATLAWTLANTNALSKFRRNLPRDALAALGASLNEEVKRTEEARRVRALWSSCRSAIQRAKPPPLKDHQLPIRHRDLLRAISDIDLDEWVHPILIRATSAYLDQGLADWSMPNRERGLLACFLDLYKHRLARLCCPFGRELQHIVREETDAGHDSRASLQTSLESLGIPADHWEPFLLAESLALRGFAGMVRQFEERPDRVPVMSIPARLMDFLAVRLLLIRATLSYAAPRVGFSGEQRDFHAWLRKRHPAPPAPSIDERTWRLFQLAQLAGLLDRQIAELSSASIGFIERELDHFNAKVRRRILHRAYEGHLRHRFFDALAGHRPQPKRHPLYQAIFCIDDREESIRRHLEEVDPDVETLGAAGFFGVAMYYRGATDAHARPLCPVSIQPRHFVTEVPADASHGVRKRMRKNWTRAGAFLDRNVHLGGRKASVGAVLFATMGVLWVIPLVLRVVFPWFQHAVARLYSQHGSRRGRLGLEHEGSSEPPPVGEQSGFTSEEMAEIVHSQLSSLGIRNRLAPLVLVFGHASSSLNNPHESAHDCGACGGGRGGPNARAFAQMANNPKVRALVTERGVAIPEGTWFIGGERNTANSDVTLFDVDLVPENARELLTRARASLEEARRREAHERCRRFDNAPDWLPPFAALLHVQSRATDLAQPRPEYGHATNAFCFIGRRQRTRGLFLDRRAFLVSYEPTEDQDGAALAGLLASVVPVVAGINLEYLFGYIDPTGYGSGTKLPHNVTSLVGVMDGAQSDLRTGLPWQMLEIHEPVRLSIVVEANASLLRNLIAQSHQLKKLVDHSWIYLAALDPCTAEIVELGTTAPRPYAPQRALCFSRGDSQSYYHGRRDHLPLAAMNENSMGQL